MVKVNLRRKREEEREAGLFFSVKSDGEEATTSAQTAGMMRLAVGGTRVL
jgi:hypothetical protein